MSQNVVVLKVGMSCQGCAGAVKRALGKMEGVESFNINMEQQKVTVTGNVDPQAVLETVSKTGKKTSFWESEASPPLPPQPTPVQALPAEAPPAQAEPEPLAQPSEVPPKLPEPEPSATAATT